MGRVFQEYIQHPITCVCGAHIYKKDDILIESIETPYGLHTGVPYVFNVYLQTTNKHCQLHIHTSAVIFDEDVCFRIPHTTTPTVDVHCISCLRLLGYCCKNLYILLA